MVVPSNTLPGPLNLGHCRCSSDWPLKWLECCHSTICITWYDDTDPTIDLHVYSDLCTVLIMESQKLSLFPIMCPYGGFLESVGGGLRTHMYNCAQTKMILFKLTHTVEHRESDCSCQECIRMGARPYALLLVLWVLLLSDQERWQYTTTWLDTDKEINFGWHITP